MEKTLFLGGAHRGGMAITEKSLETLPGFEYNNIIVVDPKEDRAPNLAQVWSENGVRSEGIKEPCEEAVNRIDADAAVLAIDQIAPMSAVLEKSALPTQWQLLARGMGIDGPVVGISGTVMDGDSESRVSSKKLIKELATFIQPQSSRNIREDPLNAEGLIAMRRKVSGHTVERLQMLDFEPPDIPGGPLNFFWGMDNYPMVVRESPTIHSWRELKEAALEAELPIFLRRSPIFVIAMLAEKNIHFFVIVESARGRRMVRFHLPIVHTLPPVSEDNRRSSGIFKGLTLPISTPSVGLTARPAVVTD
jgi:hypothetical protein